MAISIFNDVIGPVMRGPSSSHCAAALRIGRLCRDLMDGDLREVALEFDRHGSLATTHETQGSDIGLFGGLMGWEADDQRLPISGAALREAGVHVRVAIIDSHDPHPNTYRMTLIGQSRQHQVKAVSTGGGIIEIIELDGAAVSIAGDYYETLLYVSGDSGQFVAQLSERFDVDEILLHKIPEGVLVEVKAQRAVDDALLNSLHETFDVRAVKRLAPVLPVMSRKNMAVPFSTCEEMQAHEQGHDRPLWKLAAEYEAMRGGLTEDEVLERMMAIVGIVRRSIAQGVEGTQYDDRILGHQSGRFKQCLEGGALLKADATNRIVLYVTALMEVKSAMGVIVAAPTAGSCAALPGACVAMADELGLPDEEIAKALLAGGLIGVFIAHRSTFAAEVAGCQAECGAACCMAAAALVTLARGTTPQALAASSMALQSCLGMTCDPVANRVEVPCLNKNVLAATNALACANMALAGFDQVIPLDEAIEAADRVGRSLPRELRCTALGGLSITPTSLAIADRLTKARNKDSLQ